MTRSIARLLATFVMSVLCLGSAAAVERPYLVFDMDSGKVISARNANQFWYPASVTKLMNAYVTFKALREGRITLATQVTVSAHALAEPPSKMGFKVGTVIDLDNALKMMLVHSSNDIAMAVAETVGGSEEGFVARMNAEAARLGLTNTHFINPNGLPGAGQMTTARDLAVLTRQLWLEFPEYRPLFGISAIQSGDRIMKSSNTLLERYRGTVGLKTGFICSSGFNIVAAATRNGRTLTAVVLGSDNARDRAELTARLLNDGFEHAPSILPKQTLASYRGASPVPYPIDMRDAICKRKNRGENEDDPDKFDAASMQSSLEPRFQLMAPVVVTTLGLRRPDGSIQPASLASLQDDPAPVKAKPAKGTKAAKKASKKQPAAAKLDAADDADAPAKAKPAKADVSADASAPAKGKAKPPKPKPRKLEIGVPFDSTDVAPLPEPATQ